MTVDPRRRSTEVWREPFSLFLETALMRSLRPLFNADQQHALTRVLNTAGSHRTCGWTAKVSWTCPPSVYGNKRPNDTMYSHAAAVYSSTLLHHVATRSNLWFHEWRLLRHFPKVVAFVVVLQQVVAPSCCWYEIKSYLVSPPRP